MDKEFKFGQMVQNTKENGKTTKHLEKEDSTTLMVMSMMGYGKMIRPMDLVLILIKMEQSMKVIGKMTCKKVRELKLG